MPPKAKKPDANKNQGPIEDESGIPKNEVTFKFSFEIKQNEISDILIMFEWINSKDSTAREKLDTELIEGWDPKTPEDPTLVTSEVETSSFVVEDKFVKNLCSNKFYVHFVSAEDQRVKDTIMLHYSPLLMSKGEPKFEFYTDKVKIAQVESFRLTVTADKELLTPLFKDYLNPLEVCIVGAKEMPANHSGYDKYEPVYVQTTFVDGTIIKTHEHPHAATCKWAYKQVILVGLMDPVKLSENLKSYPLMFEVHDQDEVAKNQIKDFKQLIEIKYEEPEPPVDNDPKGKSKNAAAAAKDTKKKEPEKKDEKAKDAKDKGKKDPKKKKDVKTFEPIKEQDNREVNRANYGISAFNVNDLLNPHLTTVKLRNHIVPLKKYEDKDAKNLDLNTTARKDVQGLHVGCDYMTNESYLVVTFEIAHAIRPFKKPVVPEAEGAEPVAAKTKPTPAAKPTAQAKKGSVAQEEVNQTMKAVEAADEKPRLERAVYIFPYKSPDSTTKLLSIIQNINTEAFGQENNNTLLMTTKSLTEEEKSDKSLDIITGVEFIDYEYRTFILEGLSDKGMKRLEEEFPKAQPNSKKLTILKNSEFKFKDRLYINFNIDIKKIKLRENLSKLLSRPEIYLRSKVPEHIYNILISFRELRRCESMKAVVASHLFPDAENIMAMERKYGDALTDEDVDGREGSPQKVVKRVKPAQDLALSGIQSPSSYMTPVMTSKRLENISKSAEKLPAIKERGGRSLSTKLATRVDLVQHDKYSLHMTKPYTVKEGEQIFLGSGTALNVYEKQRTELREIVRNDPNHFYTYSADYLSLSIDPYNAEDIKKAELQKKKDLWTTPEGFQTVIKKSKQDYVRHSKRPHPSTVDELTSYPWHQAKLEETAQLKNSRGDPIRGGADFKLKVAGVTFFSSPEIVEAEKITAVEKERQIQEAKKRAEEEWKSRLIVENPYFYTSLCMNRSSQLDKIKGIRLGEAVKKGIVLKDSRLKATTLGTTKTLPENPISMYLSQEWEETTNKNFFERKMDPTKSASRYDFNRNIKEPHQYEFVYKPMKETFKSN